ncbi:hypothetical protein FKP32DRAFT_1681038, partial [Trametes sanguinea]
MALALPAPSSLTQVMPPNRSASLRNRRPRSPSPSPAHPPAPSTSASSSFSSATLPAPASARRAPRPDCRLLLSADLPFIDISPAPSSSSSPPRAAPAACPESPAESDSNDVPLSPIVFHPNEDYEKARLSYFGAPSHPSPLSMAFPHIHGGSGSASSPSSPQHPSPPSPVIFSHPNLSSPTLELSLPSSSLFASPPSPPAALSLSLGARLERPLPPLPSPRLGSDTSGGSPCSGSSSIREHCGPREKSDRGYRAKAGSTRTASPSSSLASYSDSDSAATAFSPPLSPSPSPSPSRASPCSSSSPPTSAYTTVSSSSEFPESAKGASRTPDARPPTLPMPHTHTKPIHLALTIPSRSQSAPLPHTQTQPQTHASSTAFVSPHISVTPASPAPHSYFPLQTPRWKKKTRTASATSIVLPSDDGCDDGEDRWAQGGGGDYFGFGSAPAPADRSRSRCGERS